MEKIIRTTVIVALVVTAMFTVLITSEVFATDKIGKLEGCTEGEIPKIEGGEWVCAEDTDTDTLATLAEMGCTTDQIAKFNGSAWECAEDETGSAGNGAMSTPIIWSGGCSRDGRGSGQRYCTDREEFNTAQAHLSVVTNGAFTVLIPGFYRINAFSWSRGGLEVSVKLVVNDGMSVTYPYVGLMYSNYRSVAQTIDVTLPFEVGYTFYVEYSGAQDAYRTWTPLNNNTLSRLQVSYLGPLPTP